MLTNQGKKEVHELAQVRKKGKKHKHVRLDVIRGSSQIGRRRRVGYSTQLSEVTRKGAYSIAQRGGGRI